ncbi:hypothetical protein ACFSCX_11845 [Bacillus salitolerans]|uniref:Uncharacterized protein n=1 Tax=Bacillus salitolerans TaxID=1437434 RepID=A0ABW4LSX1_9BACI
MKQLDWQLVFFVGASIVQDMWIYIGLPKVYYWDSTKDKPF